MQVIAPSVNRQWGEALVITAADAEFGDPAQMTLMYDFNGDGPTAGDDSWGSTVLNGGGGAVWQAGWPTKFYDDGTYE